jgi:hypothetical protein
VGPRWGPERGGEKRRKNGCGQLDHVGQTGGAERKGGDQLRAMGGAPKIAMSDSATSFTPRRFRRERGISIAKEP